jgi:regulator of chromosome condensation
MTQSVPHPEVDGSFWDVDVETGAPDWQPVVIRHLSEAGFRAVKISAGNDISVALSEEGEVRMWGTFKVASLLACMVQC